MFKMGGTNLWASFWWHMNRNFWNPIRLLAIVLFVPGIVLGNVTSGTMEGDTQAPYVQLFVIGRVCIALSYIAFFLHFLHFYAINKELGPKVPATRNRLSLHTVLVPEPEP